MKASALALAAGLFLAAPVAAAPAAGCGSIGDIVPEWPKLEHARIEVKQGKSLDIVAVGSTSTLGDAATSTAATWPAQLKEDLAKRLPGISVQVVNKARRRQLAADMLQRLSDDIGVSDPHIVIWESGTAEAVRGVDVESYRAVLLEGIDRLKRRGIDVILMDMQFARGPAAIINFEPYQAAVEEAANMEEIAYFPRFAIMRDWVENGRFVLEDLTRAEQSKVADKVYACIGTMLGELIARNVK